MHPNPRRSRRSAIRFLALPACMWGFLPGSCCAVRTSVRLNSNWWQPTPTSVRRGPTSSRALRSPACLGAPAMNWMICSAVAPCASGHSCRKSACRFSIWGATSPRSMPPRPGVTLPWRNTKRPSRPPSAKWPTPWRVARPWANSSLHWKHRPRPIAKATAWLICATATALPATCICSMPSAPCLHPSRR